METFSKVYLTSDVRLRLKQIVDLHTSQKCLISLLLWPCGPMKPFVFQLLPQVHNEAAPLPSHTSPQTRFRTIGFKAKALHICCLVCDVPSGAMTLEYLTLCHFFSVFKASPEADVLSSIQTQLQMKRSNIGGRDGGRKT